MWQACSLLTKLVSMLDAMAIIDKRQEYPKAHSKIFPTILSKLLKSTLNDNTACTNEFIGATNQLIQTCKNKIHLS